MGWWWLALPVVVPQGRIYVRATCDYQRVGRRSWKYVATNELLVLFAVGFVIGVRAMFWE